MTYDTDILIVGGGLNGPPGAGPGAGRAVRHGDRRAPAKARKASGFDGRAYALALTSQAASEGHRRLGGRVRHTPSRCWRSRSPTGARAKARRPFFMHFDHAEIEEGPMGFMVEDRHLRRGAARGDGRGQAAITPDQRRRGHGADPLMQAAQLSRSRRVTACAVGCWSAATGADQARRQRAGIKRTGWDYGQTALVCAIEHEKPHDGIAHQFFMPPGPLAILPLTRQPVSIVWSETAQSAARDPCAAMRQDYLTVLRPRFGDFLGEITLAGERFTYPLA